MTSHKKQALSPEVRKVVLTAFKCAVGEGRDITPSQLKESIRFGCVSQDVPIPSQRIVNKFLREIGLKEETTKVWLLPTNMWVFGQKVSKHV